jgi:hypothetical protein
MTAFRRLRSRSSRSGEAKLALRPRSWDSDRKGQVTANRLLSRFGRQRQRGFAEIATVCASADGRTGPE